ncbi:LLM class F420-dependent oxidoreductase [Actinophytocola xanthii]|uniref:LLM class F420-dependent oxidoreductase n=1 Tax=Actinophytocola xanthii TaxID=1912961 RepID=A0A1Q8CLW7_9PSEU|nr:LLM class F420-dependent oxidoreductase [Actinophytocola xanthii]OLF15353.1 LLM class F420-dependent oxidoreductase [Actinophytocola xanthii]
MRLGIHVMAFTVPGGTPAIAPELAKIGRAAEAAGVTHLSVMDHYFQMDQWHPATDPMLEAYTTLGFLAAHTSTIRLGVLVTGVSYRHPGLLAKIVSTLDVLSEGRGELGIGAAWYEREHRGLGVPFPPVVERFERLEETLRICRQMWDPDNEGPFEGRYYQLAETICRPLPLSGPPVLIGGGGERRTLRLVAQYADACNLFPSTPAELGRKLDVLRAHCDDVGRDYSTIQKTLAAAEVPTDVDAFATEMADYARLGFDTVMVAPPGDAPAEWIERVGTPVAARLAELG